MVAVENQLAESGAFVYDGDKVTTKDKWTSFFGLGVLSSQWDM